MQSRLEQIDIALMVAGGGIALMAAFITWRRGGLRDPLRGAPLRPNRLSPLHIWACAAVYFLGMGFGAEAARLAAPEGLSRERLLNWQGVGASLCANLLTITACLLVARRTFRAGLRGLGIGRRKPAFEVTAGVAGCLVALGLTGAVLYLSDWLIRTFLPDFQPPEHSVFEILKDAQTGPIFRVLTLLGAFLLAPAGEELLYRGMLQTGLRRLFPPRPGSMYHRWAAIVLVGVLFGVVHWGTPQFIPALAFLGVFLGFLYERTGSLTACILVHMLFNGKSLLWDYLLRL